MDNAKYQASVHRLGRIGVLIGILFMLGIPAAVCIIFDVWPSSVGDVIALTLPMLAMFVPTSIAEVLGYAPILGTSSYITFLTGNITNLKMPVVLNAQNLAEVTPGTDEGDTIASIGVAASSIVTTLIIAVGVILMVPLAPVLTSAPVQTASAYMLPALLGGLVLNFIGKNCGEYRADNKTLILIIPLALVFIYNIFRPVAGGKEGYIVIACMVVNVLLAYVLLKKGIIKMQKKSEMNVKAVAEEEK